jgi:hypothetical protein
LGDYQVEVKISLFEENLRMVEQMIKEYLESFRDYIHDTILEYESRDGSRVGFQGNPTRYEFKIA